MEHQREVAAVDRGHGWSLAVYLLFFLSGMTSLIYEVIWGREFGLVFGVTTYAVSTVLAAFFAGLAIGSYLAGRIIDRGRLHPLVVYGGMEGVVGLYALLLPVLLGWVEATYPAVYSRIGESFTLFTFFRFLVCFALLVAPTTLMGATLPVLSKLMVDRESVLGFSVGNLYAVNTFGAVAGAATAGFVLIAAVGVPGATLTAAVGNFVLAAAALGLSRLRVFAWSPRGPRAGAQAAVPLGGRERLILGLAFVSGLTILALEVVWTRSLVLILGSTTYAFSTMLTAVLVGIAVGSAVFAPHADRSRNPALVVAALMGLGGLFAVLGPGVINRLPFVFLRLTDWAGGSWALVIGAQFAVCFLLVLVPTFLSGASFPILVRMYSLGGERVGRTVADVYAINTFGGILGSLVGGFVLVKFLGLQPALTVAALVLLGGGGLLAIALARPLGRQARSALAAAVAVVVVVLAFVHPRFETKLLFAGWGPFAGGYYVGRSGTTVDVTDRHMQRLRYHKEGVSAAVDVLETGWGEKIISVNAQPVATTYLLDMRALQMLGDLPVLLHPDPQEALLIGLGAGVSSGIIATYPKVKHVTVVELSEEVPGGTAQFADWNYNVLKNPKVKLVINDGANYVKATRKQYDIISSDPIHPFIAGNGILYSYEHWKICKDRLKEGGVLAQWLPLYQLSPTDFATIIRTFVDVFPNATMWFCGIDTVLIGTKGDHRISLKRMGEHMSDPKVMAHLLSMGVQKPADVLGWYVAGPEQLDAMGGDAPVNRVDRPILEFTAPRAIRGRLVAATMPALLTACQQLPEEEAWRQIEAMCDRPLDPATLRQITVSRQAGRWLMRAQLLSSYDDAERYLAAARQAYALRPGDSFLRCVVAEALWSAGNAQLLNGYPEAAYHSFREAYSYDPSNVNALTSAASVALEMGDWRLAEQTLELAAPAQRDIFQVVVCWGMAAMAKKDYAAAEEYFRRAADPARGQESPYLHVGLGLLALREGDRERAHQHFARALRVATQGLQVILNLVEACDYHGFKEEARAYAPDLIRTATQAIAEDPSDPTCYRYRARGYEVLGEKRNADRDYAAAEALVGWWEEPMPESWG